MWFNCMRLAYAGAKVIRRAAVQALPAPVPFSYIESGLLLCLVRVQTRFAAFPRVCSQKQCIDLASCLVDHRTGHQTKHASNSQHFWFACGVLSAINLEVLQGPQYSLDSASVYS